jgi:hypothetical protein
MTTHPLEIILFKPLDLDPIASCWLLHVYLREQNKKNQMRGGTIMEWREGNWVLLH